METQSPTFNYSALPAGVVLNGAYQLMNVLGAGGFGITYLAWDTIRERHVVIKECLPGDYAHRDDNSYHVSPINDEAAPIFFDCLANTRNEAETLARFSNPGVVQVHDLFEQNGTFYYVMEYIQGQTLHDFMTGLRQRGESIPPDQAEGLLVYILEILGHLHRQKIYHCDIKPGNIFILPSGMPKLIDFGAVRSKEIQHQGLIQITPGYTPPEFYPGSLRVVGPWSDIYELGATFYELLTGEVPEPSNQRFKVDRMVKISSIEGLRNLYPLVFLSSIDKALSPDHNQRFKSAEAWIEYIDSYGSGRQMRTLNPHSQSGARLRAAGMPALLQKKKKKKSNAGFAMGVVFFLLLGFACLGIRQGKIDLNPYNELHWLRDLLGAPVTETPDPAPADPDAKTATESALPPAPSDTGEEAAPAPGLKLVPEADGE